MDQAVLKQILDMEAAGTTEQPRYMQLLMPNGTSSTSCAARRRNGPSRSRAPSPTSTATST